jgi:hypothetical protein
VNRTTVVLTG